MNMPVKEDALTVMAPDGWPLAATVFTPETGMPDADNQRSEQIVVISGAAGVPQTYYANFSRFLVSEGFAAVITYDYRGMAQSRGERSRWKGLRMYQWGLLDFPAVVQTIRSRYPDADLLGLGHSYGGQLLGLSDTHKQFSRYATVATMSGYWKDLGTPWTVWAQTQIVGRALAATLGYIPAFLGPGSAFPGPIMKDWADWIKAPDYWFSRPDMPDLSQFGEVTLPYLSVGLTDDPWGRPQPIRSFMQHYTKADLRQLWVEPGESGPVGHIGMFRRAHRESHWPIMAAFLKSGEFPSGAEPL